MQWLEPVARDYASRAAVLAAYRSVSLLERGPGLSVHGLIAVCCKLALEVAEPFAGSFPTPAEKLRLFLFLADPAQRFFAHDGRSSSAAAAAVRSLRADGHSRTTMSSTAPVPVPARLPIAASEPALLAPSLPSSASAGMPATISHSGSVSRPGSDASRHSQTAQSEWRGAVAQLDDLLHSLSGSVLASPLLARAAAARASGSGAASLLGRQETLAALSAYEQEQELLARAAQAEAAVLAPALGRSTQVGQTLQNSLLGATAPEPEDASRARLGALLDSASAAVGLLAARRGLSGAESRVEPLPAAVASLDAAVGIAASSESEAPHPAADSAANDADTPPAVAQLPLQYADTQPLEAPAAPELHSLPPQQKQRLTASGDEVAAFVQRRRASMSGQSPTNAAAAAAVAPVAHSVSGSAAGVSELVALRGRRMSTSSTASKTVAGSRPGPGRVIVGLGAGAAASNSAVHSHSSPLSSDAGSARAGALVAGYDAWLTKHDRSQPRSRSRSASVVAGIEDSAAAAAAAAGTVSGDGGSAAGGGPFVAAGSSSRRDSACSAPAAAASAAPRQCLGYEDWHVPADRALCVGELLRAAHCIDVRAADKALHGLFHRYALYGDRARYSMGTASSTGAGGLGGTAAAIAAARPYGESSAYGVVVPRLHSHEAPQSDDIHAHAFAHSHGGGSAGAGAGTGALRDSRLLAGQFVKLCGDAGVVGRGGAGSGVVRRGDLEVVFMSALSLVQHVIESQQVEQGQLQQGIDRRSDQGNSHSGRERSSSRGRSGGGSGASSSGGYSQREAARAVISRGIDFGSFVHALALLAVKRFCAPAGTVGAGSAAVLSESAAAAAVRAGADVVTVVAAQEEVAVRRFYSDRGLPLPRVPQVGHDALDAFARDSGDDATVAARAAAAAALHADHGLVLVHGGQQDGLRSSATSHAGAGAGAAAVAEQQLPSSPCWAVAADVASLPIPASLLSSSMALRLLLVRCLLPLAARIGLVPSLAAVVRPLRILPSQPHDPAAAADAAEADAAPPDAEASAATAATHVEARDGNSTPGHRGHGGHVHFQQYDADGHAAHGSNAAADRAAPASAGEAPPSDAADRAAVSRLALPRSRSSSATRNSTAAAPRAGGTSASNQPLAFAQQVSLPGFAGHAAEHAQSQAPAARVELWAPEADAHAVSGENAAADAHAGVESPSVLLAELGETLQALAKQQSSENGLVAEAAVEAAVLQGAHPWHWPAASLVLSQTGSSASAVAAGGSTSGYGASSMPLQRLYVDPRGSTKALLLLPPRSVSEALSFVTASLDGLSVFGAPLTTPSHAMGNNSMFGGSASGYPARSLPMPAAAAEKQLQSKACGRASAASAPGSAEKAVAALIAAQTGELEAQSQAHAPAAGIGMDHSSATVAGASGVDSSASTVTVPPSNSDRIELTAQQLVGLLSAASAAPSASHPSAVAEHSAAASAAAPPLGTAAAAAAVPLPSLGSLFGHSATRTPAPSHLFTRSGRGASQQHGRVGSASRNRSGSRGRSSEAREAVTARRSAQRSAAHLQAATQSLVAALSSNEGGAGAGVRGKLAHLRAEALVLAAQDAVATLRRKRHADAAAETGSQSSASPTSSTASPTSSHVGLSPAGGSRGGSAADSPASGDSADAPSLASAPGRLTASAAHSAAAGSAAAATVHSNMERTAAVAGTGLDRLDRGRSAGRHRQQQRSAVVSATRSRSRGTSASRGAAADASSQGNSRRRVRPPPVVPFGSTAERGLAWGGGHSGTPHVATGHFHVDARTTEAGGDHAHAMTGEGHAASAPHGYVTLESESVPVSALAHALAPAAAASASASASGTAVGEALIAGAKSETQPVAPIVAAKVAPADVPTATTAVQVPTSAPTVDAVPLPVTQTVDASPLPSASPAPPAAVQTLGPDGEPLVRAARLSLRQQLSPANRDASAAALINTPAAGRHGRRAAARAAAREVTANTANGRRLTGSDGDDECDADAVDAAGSPSPTRAVPSTDRAQREWERRFMGQGESGDDDGDSGSDGYEADGHDAGASDAAEAGRSQADNGSRRTATTRGKPLWSPTAGATGLAASIEHAKDAADSDGAHGGAAASTSVPTEAAAASAGQRGRRTSSGRGVRFSPGSAGSPGGAAATTPSGDSPTGFTRMMRRPHSHSHPYATGAGTTAEPEGTADGPLASPSTEAAASGPGFGRTPHANRRRSRAAEGDSDAHAHLPAQTQAAAPADAGADADEVDSAASSPDRRALNSSVAELLASPDGRKHQCSGAAAGSRGAGVAEGQRQAGAESERESEYDFVRVPHSSHGASGSGLVQHHSYGSSTGALSGAGGVTAVGSSFGGAGGGAHDFSSFSHHAALLATPGAIIAVPRRRSIMPATLRKAPASAAAADAASTSAVAAVTAPPTGDHHHDDASAHLHQPHAHVHWSEQPHPDAHRDQRLADAAALSPGSEAALWLQRYRAQQAELEHHHHDHNAETDWTGPAHPATPGHPLLLRPDHEHQVQMENAYRAHQLHSHEASAQQWDSAGGSGPVEAGSLPAAGRHYPFAHAAQPTAAATHAPDLAGAADAPAAGSPDALRSSRNFARSLQAAATEEHDAASLHLPSLRVPQQSAPDMRAAPNADRVHLQPQSLHQQYQHPGGYHDAAPVAGGSIGAPQLANELPSAHGNGPLLSPLLLQPEHLAFPLATPQSAAPHPNAVSLDAMALSTIAPHASAPHARVASHSAARRVAPALSASTPLQFDVPPVRLTEAAASGSTLAQELEFVVPPPVRLTTAQTLAAVAEKLEASIISEKLEASIISAAAASAAEHAAVDEVRVAAGDSDSRLDMPQQYGRQYRFEHAHAHAHAPVVLSFPLPPGGASSEAEAASAVPPSPGSIPVPIDWAATLPVAAMGTRSSEGISASTGAAGEVGVRSDGWLTAAAFDDRSGASFDGIGMLAGSFASDFKLDDASWPTHLPSHHRDAASHTPAAELSGLLGGSRKANGTLTAQGIASPSLLSRMMQSGNGYDAAATASSAPGTLHGSVLPTASEATRAVTHGSMPPTSPGTLLPARGASESIMRSPAFEMAPSWPAPGAPGGSSGFPVRASIDAALLTAMAAEAVASAAAAAAADADPAGASEFEATAQAQSISRSNMLLEGAAPALLSPGAGVGGGAGAGARSSLLTGGLFSLSESSGEGDADESGAERNAEARELQHPEQLELAAQQEAAAANDSASSASASAALHMLSGVGATSSPGARNESSDDEAGEAEDRRWTSPGQAAVRRYAHDYGQADTAASVAAHTVEYASAVKAAGPAQRRVLRTPHAAPPTLLPSQLPWQLLARARAGHAEALRLAESAGTRGDEQEFVELVEEQEQEHEGVDREKLGTFGGFQQGRELHFASADAADSEHSRSATGGAPATSPAEPPAWGPEEQAVYDEAYAYVLASGVHDIVAAEHMEGDREGEAAGSSDGHYHGDAFDEAGFGLGAEHDLGHAASQPIPDAAEDVYEWSAAEVPSGLRLAPLVQLSHHRARAEQLPRAFSFDAHSEQSDSEAAGAPAATLLEEADDDAGAAMAPPVSTASVQGSARDAELWRRDDQRLPSGRSRTSSGSAAASRPLVSAAALSAAASGATSGIAGTSGAAATHAVKAKGAGRGSSPAPAPVPAAAKPGGRSTPQRSHGHGGVAGVLSGHSESGASPGIGSASASGQALSGRHHASPARPGLEGGRNGSGAARGIQSARSGALWAQVLGE